ncbi:alanine racemase [Rhizobium sp. ARZ01]|uniref:alanine racemase n=1 Tax=Rhizobium sp. ARZ01 TaxID=2769313 RepID=UPI0017824D11|nr:alanine racemase [Rhizobium sp. ARZ01]MBD9375063.1 alanine racemase [Rhizobium sp. ARZ01]
MADERRTRRWTRRALIIGGGAAVVGGTALLAARKEDRGGTHDQYFLALSNALRQAGIARPVLVIDVNRLDHNLAATRQALAPKRLPLRVVVKSLPAQGLIEHVARGMATNRFMVFNGAMLATMAQRAEADLLLGKPLPAAQVAELLDALGPAAAGRVQWLVDTPDRLQKYAEIARGKSIKLRTNFEIDIGLHRGGFPTTEALAAGLDLAKQSPEIAVTGLMGYDPHVPKMLDPDAAYDQAQDKYRAAIGVMGEVLGIDLATLTLNGAGSPTYTRHAQNTVANEVSVGSAFAKPADFDLPELAQHVPAAFIATPVVKALDRMHLPGNEWLSGPLNFIDPNTKRAFFIYGGHWLATPESPPGLEFNSLYGRSSNQELLTGSDRIALKPDDFVFFRPNQSEAVFLQFGDIALFDGTNITGYWPTFPVSA